MLKKSKASDTITRMLFAGFALVVFSAAIAAGLLNKKSFERKTITRPTLNEASGSNHAVHPSAVSQPQTSAQIDISHNVIAGGGGSSTGGSLKIEGTIGQPAVGTTMSGGQFSQTGGFWQPLSGATPTPSPTPSPSPTPTPTASPTPSPSPTPTPSPTAIQLILEEAGPTPTQAAALDAVLFLRDMFPVINSNNLLNTGFDPNTRVTIFVTNLELLPGEASSSVAVNLIDSSNQTYSIPAEDVRLVPNFGFAQVIFRLPNNLSVGTCSISVSAHGQFSNTATIRIRI